MWVSMWMLVVPLFHVHPEADHLHGETGHVHGGMVHTVLSQDLDCESSSNTDAGVVTADGKVDNSLSAPPLHRWNGHPEVSFSLLSGSTDRKCLKPLLTQAEGFSSIPVSDLQAHDWLDQNGNRVPFNAFFIHEFPSRAPPAFLL